MKNLFGGDDSSLVLTTVVGVVVLVFVALGIGLLADGSVQLSSLSGNASEIRNQNDNLRRKINKVEIDIVARDRQEEKTKQNQEKVKLLTDLNKQLSTAREEINILESVIKEAEGSIQLIIKGKETHLAKYRESVRANAVGETYDEITTLREKKYLKVSINEVTSLGVAISHKYGAALLDFKEMPIEWRKKFMYTAGEVAQATLEEEKRFSRADREMARRHKEAAKIRRAKVHRDEIAKLHRSIATMSLKYSSANLEASLARGKVASQSALARSKILSNSNYSYRRYNPSTGTYTTYYRPRYRISVNARQSVPGRLETWEQRTRRYQRLANQYAIQLENMRARLKSLDPTYVYTPLAPTGN